MALKDLLILLVFSVALKGILSDTNTYCCTKEALCIANITEDECYTDYDAYIYDEDNCVPGLCTWVVDPYVDPLVIPKFLAPTSGMIGCSSGQDEVSYEIEMQEFYHYFHRDIPLIKVWGYAGQYPGPTISACANTKTIVSVIHDIRDVETGLLRTEHLLPVNPCNTGPHEWGSLPRASLHLHGAHVGGGYDGHPEFHFFPGESRTYEYPNTQTSGTLFYHDHTMGISRLNVGLGLIGAYIINDEEDAKYNLPTGEYDVPLIVQDFTFEANATVYAPWIVLEGTAFKTFVVNGVVTPYHNVTREIYRFRLINGCTNRNFTFYLSSGEDFTVIASDGALWDAPRNISTLQMEPSDRFEFLIDFRNKTVNDTLELLNTDMDPAPYIVQFQVQNSTGPGTFEIPTSLRDYDLLKEEDAVYERFWELSTGSDYSCEGKHTWEILLINAPLRYDDITDFVTINTTEKWVFANPHGRHPVHIHSGEFLIYEKEYFELTNGTYIATGESIDIDEWERDVYHDTFTPHEGALTRVLMAFDNVGRFQVHCHLLAHEDHEMMRQFRVHYSSDTCNNNSVCEVYEDCISCPNDCPWIAGSLCGNNLCEAANSEDCYSCPEDCLSSDDVCCGYNGTCDPTVCINTTLMIGCREMVVNDVCCGDTVCDPHTSKNAITCPIDCQAEVSESESSGLAIALSVVAILCIATAGVVAYFVKKQRHSFSESDYQLLGDD